MPVEFYLFTDSITRYSHVGERFKPLIRSICPSYPRAPYFYATWPASTQRHEGFYRDRGIKLKVKRVL